MNIFWTRYLTVAIAGFFAMGFGFTFVPMIPALDGLMGFLDAFLLGAAILDPEFARFRHFAFGVIGGLTAGWAVTIYFVAKFALFKGERWGWFAVTEGLIVWYVLDTWASLAAGMATNAVMNTLYAAAVLAPPLIALRPRQQGDVGAVESP